MPAMPVRGPKPKRSSTARSRKRPPRRARRSGSPGRTETELSASGLAAVPFVEPHQLVIFAVGRIFRMELGGERLVPGQPCLGGGDEVAGGDSREFGRIEAGPA